jgi:hypothetical protein
MVARMSFRVLLTACNLMLPANNAIENRRNASHFEKPSDRLRQQPPPNWSGFAFLPE